MPLARRKGFATRIVTAASTIALGLCVFAGPTTQPTTPLLDDAIARLSSDDWKVRQRAQDELVAAGESAVPRLQELADRSADAEVRTRAQAATKLIAEARELGPSLLTIHLQDATPKAIFDEIAKQGRTQFSLWPSNLWNQRGWRRIDVDVDRRPFWEVTRDVCARTGCHLQQIGSDRRLSIAQGGDNWTAGPAVASGPFMIVARSLSRSSNVDLAQPQNVQRDFSISFVVLPEPKLRILQSSYEAKVEVAVDDRGTSLVPTTASPEAGELMNNNSFPYNVTARLSTAAPGGGKRIARLRCSTQFLVQTRRDVIEVPDLLNARNVTKTVAGRRLVVRSVQKNGEQYSVSVSLYRDDLSRADWEQFRSPSSQIQVLDAGGNAFSPRGWSGGGSDAEMQYTFEFARQPADGDESHRPGEPDKLVWELPLESRLMTIPFEFNDLPMP